MESSKRIIYSRNIFITGIILLGTLSVLFIYETYQEYTSTSVIDNTKSTRVNLEKIFSELEDRESGIIRYALTSDSTYWHIHRSTGFLREKLIAMDSITYENLLQESGHHELKQLLRATIDRQEALAAKLGHPQYIKSDSLRHDLKKSSLQMDSLRILIDGMQAKASAFLKAKSIDAQKHTIIATMMGVTVSIFSIIVFILAFYFIDQELKRSQNYLDETQSLNTKIGEINKELEEANRNLLELNNELGEKNFQLEKYASELSSFTHITSHDMQEPLRKIEFYISIVDAREKENLSEDGKKYLAKINKSVNRMRQLFLSMLEFSLTKTTTSNIETVDLNDVLHQTLLSLKVYMKDTNATIENDPLPEVKGIKYQLIQLFENIISNAIKFRRQHVLCEIQIQCTTIQSGKRPVAGLKKDSEYYKIDFIDNGIGFESQYAEKIFEIFQRLIPGGDSHSVGIGLAICRKIAENHGGILLANAKPDEGAVFSLYIPKNV
jgi:signal transduction histidine kinase